MFSCHQERKGEEIINRSNRPGRDVAADILPVLRRDRDHQRAARIPFQFKQPRPGETFGVSSTAALSLRPKRLKNVFKLFELVSHRLAGINTVIEVLRGLHVMPRVEQDNVENVFIVPESHDTPVSSRYLKLVKRKLFFVAQEVIRQPAEIFPLKGNVSLGPVDLMIPEHLGFSRVAATANVIHCFR